MNLFICITQSPRLIFYTCVVPRLVCHRGDPWPFVSHLGQDEARRVRSPARASNELPRTIIASSLTLAALLVPQYITWNAHSIPRPFKNPHRSSWINCLMFYMALADTID
jgi:hypothetical protein